jgi:hypothetical protein
MIRGRAEPHKVESEPWIAGDVLQEFVTPSKILRAAAARASLAVVTL